MILSPILTRLNRNLPISIPSQSTYWLCEMNSHCDPFPDGTVTRVPSSNWKTKYFRSEYSVPGLVKQTPYLQDRPASDNSSRRSVCRCFNNGTDRRIRTIWKLTDSRQIITAKHLSDWQRITRLTTIIVKCLLCLSLNLNVKRFPMPFSFSTNYIHLPWLARFCFENGLILYYTEIRRSIFSLNVLEDSHWTSAESYPLLPFLPHGSQFCFSSSFQVRCILKIRG